MNSRPELGHTSSRACDWLCKQLTFKLLPHVGQSAVDRRDILARNNEQWGRALGLGGALNE
jgi:hypothetical protein